MDAQSYINEITKQRNEALDRCALLASEIVNLRSQVMELQKPKVKKSKKK